MQVEVRTDVKPATLILRGVSTSGEAGAIRSKIDELLHEGYREFALDLEGLRSLDSEGLGEIVRIYVTVRKAGGTVKLLNLNKRINDLLSIAKLRDWF